MSEQAAPSSKLAIFRHRGFTLLLVSRVVAAVGQQMLNVSIGYLIWVLTKDALNLAFVGLAQFIPAMVLALFTGHAADRFDRRLVVATCYAVQGICASLFVAYLVFEIQVIWPLFATLTVLGAARAFYQPAMQALMPNLVPEKDVPTAIAWGSSSNKMANIASPALGGLLYDLFGPMTVFGVASGFYILAMFLISSIASTTQKSKREPLSWDSLVAGFSYMRVKSILLGAMTMDLFAVLFGGLTALLPIYATDVFDSGASALGLLRSSPSVGALLAGLILTQIPPMRRSGLVLYASVAAYGLSTLAFAYSDVLLLSMFALALVGASDMVSAYIRLTIIQLNTPDHMRGRVSAVNSMFTTASNELGEFRAGIMAVAFGAVSSAAIGGIAVLVVTAACWKLFPDLARADRLESMN